MPLKSGGPAGFAAEVAGKVGEEFDSPMLGAEAGMKALAIGFGIVMCVVSLIFLALGTLICWQDGTLLKHSGLNLLICALIIIGVLVGLLNISTLPRWKIKELAAKKKGINIYGKLVCPRCSEQGKVERWSSRYYICGGCEHIITDTALRRAN